MEIPTIWGWDKIWKLPVVWYGYFLELANVTLSINCSLHGRCSKEKGKGSLSVRETQGVHEEGGGRTPARMLLLFML